ncbi:hypothetical protein CBR_g36334 [Chara braunii]|uniref:SAP domain-containing protein n=1 Tax=Chara braunii TaxID=69332 RepID=A0A388LKP4_CHABU|nr:hypothetical protein CBR_g36334 [Chara braunii]|eukprot:GBG82803.1 hypothetical protein CBR_g36334 [Chara braunii]
MAFLAGLPSRGNFAKTTPGSVLQGLLPVYICDRDTSPPEEQYIRTDTTNILIRALKKGKDDSKAKDLKGKAAQEDHKGKRPSAAGLDDRPMKRVNASGGSGGGHEPGTQGAAVGSSGRKENAGGSSGGVSGKMSEKELQNLTVDKLKALLKENGLPLKGKKDELIARAKRAM